MFSRNGAPTGYNQIQPGLDQPNQIPPGQPGRPPSTPLQNAIVSPPNYSQDPSLAQWRQRPANQPNQPLTQQAMSGGQQPITRIGAPNPGDNGSQYNGPNFGAAPPQVRIGSPNPQDTTGGGITPNPSPQTGAPLNSSPNTTGGGITPNSQRSGMNYGGGWNEHIGQDGAAQALKQAFDMGLTGQQAVDHVNQNTPYKNQIAYYPDKNQYGAPGWYAAPNQAAGGALDLIQRNNGGGGAPHPQMTAQGGNSSMMTNPSLLNAVLYGNNNQPTPYMQQLMQV